MGDCIGMGVTLQSFPIMNGLWQSISDSVGPLESDGIICTLVECLETFREHYELSWAVYLYAIAYIVRYDNIQGLSDEPAWIMGAVAAAVVTAIGFVHDDIMDNVDVFHFFGCRHGARWQRRILETISYQLALSEQEMVMFEVDYGVMGMIYEHCAWQYKEGYSVTCYHNIQ
jgi:hypothetical protein